MAVLTMSERELDRVEVLRDLDQGRLGASSAAGLMGTTERHVWRLLRAYRRASAVVRATVGRRMRSATAS